MYYIKSFRMQISFNSAPSGSPGGLGVSHRLPTTAKLSRTPVPRDKQNGVMQVMEADESTSTREILVEKADTTTVEMGVEATTSSTAYYFTPWMNYFYMAIVLTFVAVMILVPIFFKKAEYQWRSGMPLALQCLSDPLM